MATVSYSSAHTPYQQAPASLLPAASLADRTTSTASSSEADQRVLSNQMIEAMDAEIGRVLVDTGVPRADRTARSTTIRAAPTR